MISLKSERIEMTDPRTGIRVVQLTSYPTPSAHFTYDWPSITPDNGRIVLFCQRFGRRGAPWDICRADVDGLNFVQLTRRGDRAEEGGYYGRPAAILTLDGKTVYAAWGQAIARVDVESGKTEEVCSLARHCAGMTFVGSLCLSFGGNRLFVGTRGERSAILRVELTTGTTDQVDLGGALFGTVRGESRMVVQRGTVVWGTTQRQDGTRRIANVGDTLSIWTCDEDGGDAHFLSPQIFAHATPIGPGRRMQGCGLPPHRCIWIAEQGKEPEKAVQGPYFWHSAASFDGEWIVADTNWPDCGLQLVHVPTNSKSSPHFRTLCHPGATLGHVEYGHPHPTISQDGRIVAFRSDRTGMSQMYVAHVTDEFRDSVRAGVLDNPNDKWM